MIPNDINSEEGLNEYLIKLGFRRKSSIKELEGVRTGDNTMLYFDVNKSIAVYYFKNMEGMDVMITSIGNTSGDCSGYSAVIKFLNEEFVEYFRKEKIKKLLDDK